MADNTKLPKQHVELRTPAGDSAMDDTNDAVKVQIEADNVGIGGGTQYAVNAVAGATDTGTLALVVRDDSLTTLSEADGDYTQLRVSSTGALHVTGNVTNAGTFAVQVDGAALTALQLIDDAVHTDDAAFTLGTSKGMMMMGFAGTQSVNSNDAAALACDTDGALHISDGGNSLTVDGTVSVSGTVTVDLGANNDVVQATASNFNAQVVGNVANDIADSGNPVKVGAHATNSVEGETQVANNDRVDLKADLNGVMLTRNATTLEELISERVSDTGGNSTNFTTFNAGGAGIHNYITSVTIHNAHASTNGYVDLRDGSAGSIIWTFPAPANGGATHNFDPPLKGAANTALAYDVSAAITTVYISVNGFQAQG